MEARVLTLMDSLTTNEKVLALTSFRLKMNRPYIKKWPEVTFYLACK